jgi:Predicted glycosylase
MAGKFVKNKGMALFPRRINGNYVMSGRLDGVNRYIMESDNVLVWNRGRQSETPKYWWEFSIIGNCGSPVETPEGWLMLTHGVGPCGSMPSPRRCSISRTRRRSSAGRGTDHRAGGR